jgi:hypothetical protein
VDEVHAMKLREMLLASEDIRTKFISRFDSFELSKADEDRVMAVAQQRKILERHNSSAVDADSPAWKAVTNYLAIKTFETFMVPGEKVSQAKLNTTLKAMDDMIYNLDLKYGMSDETSGLSTPQLFGATQDVQIVIQALDEVQKAQVKAEKSRLGTVHVHVGDKICSTFKRLSKMML